MSRGRRCGARVRVSARLFLEVVKLEGVIHIE